MGQSSVIAPERSPDQRREALRKANQIRVDRGQLKKGIKAGVINVCEILREPPDYINTMKVFDLLMTIPKFGGVKAARHLSICRISPSKTVEGLSHRQRDELIKLINSR